MAISHTPTRTTTTEPLDVLTLDPAVLIDAERHLYTATYEAHHTAASAVRTYGAADPRAIASDRLAEQILAAYLVLNPVP